MGAVAGDVLRLGPPQASSTVNVYDAAFETVAPATANYAVAVLTVSALAGLDPAMGQIGLWNQTKGAVSSVRVVGNQADVVVVLAAPAAGDLLQVSALPIGYSELPPGRVWVQECAVTLTDVAPTQTTDTYLPPNPPTIIGATAGGSISWIAGNTWGAALLAVHFRWRRPGLDTEWNYLWGQAATSPTVIGAFNPIFEWEMQAAETSAAGVSIWSTSFVFGASPLVSAGFGLQPFGTSPFGGSEQAGVAGYGENYGQDYGGDGI